MGKTLDSESEARVLEMRKSGMRLSDIGHEFGVSGEWIRQTIERISPGLNASVKKKKIASTRGRSDKVRDRARDSRAKNWDMERVEFESHVLKYGAGPKSPRGRFFQQRESAFRREVGWELTFGQWWKIWSDSGMWDSRGRGQYVMARKGDVGPYSEGNVYICTASQNTKDSYINTPWEERKRSALHSKIRAEDRFLILADARSGVELAEAYGVTPQTIYVIRRKNKKASAFK